jgi:hypothetical protein
METLIIVPPADELLSRLHNVNPSPDLMTGFYPLIARWGGTRKPPLGVVNMVIFAIEEYAGRGGSGSGLVLQLQSQVPDFIRAIVPDATHARECLAQWEEICSMA